MASSPLYAASGAIRVTLDDATQTGRYMPNGSWRVNTTDVGPGIYAPDGAIRGVFDETDPGVYDATGAIRMSETDDLDGSWFVEDVTPE